MSDLVEKLPQIPVIMKNRGWKTASALMQKWFDGPASDERDKQTPDTTDVTMAWVLGFPRAAAVYDKLVSDHVWTNMRAQAEISHMLRNKLLTVKGPVPFGNLNLAAPLLNKNYVTRASYVSSIGDPLDDLFGALGSFNFHVAVQGTIKPDKSSTFEITLKQVGIYVYDSYDFQDDHWYSQPLGFWKFDGKGDVGKIPWPHYYEVTNSTFREYRTAKHRGGDFWVYSDVKVLNVLPPFKFMAKL